MTYVQNFTFVPGVELRAIILEEQPWFMARDVLDALDITNTATSVLANLADEDKRRFSLGLPGKSPWLVSESGLYDMIFRSKKPEAAAFQKWVTKEVLPAICLSRKIAASKGQRIALGHKAGVLGDLAGRPKIKVPREYVNPLGEVKQGVAVLHTIKALERAAEAIGLEENAYA
jgi:hypothetical protein